MESGLQCMRYVTSENLHAEFQLPRLAHHQLENASIPDPEIVIVHKMLPLGAEPLPLGSISIVHDLPLPALVHENCRYLHGRKNVVHFGRQELHIEWNSIEWELWTKPESLIIRQGQMNEEEGQRPDYKPAWCGMGKRWCRRRASRKEVGSNHLLALLRLGTWRCVPEKSYELDHSRGSSHGGAKSDA